MFIVLMKICIRGSDSEPIKSINQINSMIRNEKQIQRMPKTHTKTAEIFARVVAKASESEKRIRNKNARRGEDRHHMHTVRIEKTETQRNDDGKCETRTE